MADNVNITPGSGNIVAADEVTDGTLGTVKVQYVKIMDGTIDGTLKAAVSSNGLKVDGSGATQPVSGTVIATQATGSNLHVVVDTAPTTAVTGPLTDTQLRATPVPVSGTVTITPSGTQNVTVTNAAGASAVNIQDGGNSITVDGTVTVVQPTGTNLHVVVDSAPTTAVTGPLTDTQLRASAVPISAASLPLPTGASTAVKQPALGTAGTASTDVITIQGIASMTKLLVTPDSVALPANQSVNVSQINGVTPLMGNGATGTGSPRVTLSNDNTAIANWGQGSTGAAVPSGAVYRGGLAQTALPSAATAGNLTGTLLDKFGRQVVVAGTLRDLKGTQSTTISASTSETTIITAGASGIFNDLVTIIVSNTSASTNTRIDFRDATGGTVIFSLLSPGSQTVGFSIPGESIPQTTAANNWTAQCSASTTDIRIFALYEKNK